MRTHTTASFTILFALATACATNEDDTMAADAEESEDSADDSGSAADDADAESGGPAESSDGGEEDSSEGGADDTSTGVDVDALWECQEEQMIFEARPLVGPGYDGTMGGLLEPLQGTYTVSATKAWVSEDQLGDFMEVSDRVTAELEATPGMVAYALGIEPTCGFFRTLGIYRSQEDMFGFVFSDAHSEAISRAGELTITGKTTSWELSADEFPPTWAMADEKLVNVPAF